MSSHSPNPQTPRVQTKNLGLWIALAAAVVISVMIVYSESQKPTFESPSLPTAGQSTYSPQKEETTGPCDLKKNPECQLAFLDCDGCRLTNNDRRVNRIRFLLKHLTVQTGESIEAIAERTNKATQVVHRAGKEVTNERFLEEAKAFYDGIDRKVKYDEASTLLVMALRQ